MVAEALRGVRTDAASAGRTARRGRTVSCAAVRSARAGGPVPVRAPTSGVIPIQHWPNHEIALITKFFEYAHARLPMVVSDVRTMAERPESTGQGEVFRAEDLDDYVRAVTAGAGRPAALPRRVRPARPAGEWTWPAQAEVVDEVYARLPALTQAGRSPEHAAM